ncbi:MAG: hypothetical protein NTY77_17260 [Elusimicrobia bacterium]|nr:hypothetical protein [Elusimicrobiota bacterium]
MAVLALLSVQACQEKRLGTGEILALRINRVSEDDGRSAFRQLCRKAFIPCGLELVENPKSQAPKPFLAEEEVLESALNRLVATSLKGYAWRVSDGVLEMAPEAVLAGKKSSPLEKRIPEVDVRGGIDSTLQESVLEKICLAAGIVKPYFARAIVGPGGPEANRRVSVRLRDVTVREALNAVVRRDGHSLWEVIETPDGNGVYGHCWSPKWHSMD